ncbi:MAG: DUF4167 domain-containing protein [Pseudolabrys sp.]
MRNGQKRMRGRGNHRKSQNPMTRVFESNGPDVKIRGTASHIAEKYIQLARDAQSSGDPVAAENYYQHAEHYFRLIAAAQEQMRQQNPYYNQQQPQSPQGAADEYDESEDEGQPYPNEPSVAPRGPQPQPYLPADAQPFPPREQPVVQAIRQPQPGEGEEVGLPAFITGGGQPQANGQPNGHDQAERGNGTGTGHRRRRRRSNFRGERGESSGAAQAEGEQPSE